MALAQGTELARHRTIRRSTRNKEEGSGQPAAEQREVRWQQLDAIFKALADSTRREILKLLIDRPLAVHEIVGHFHLTQPSISRHLSILRAAGLVLHERRGQRGPAQVDEVAGRAARRTGSGPPAPRSSNGSQGTNTRKV